MKQIALYYSMKTNQFMQHVSTDYCESTSYVIGVVKDFCREYILSGYRIGSVWSEMNVLRVWRKKTKLKNHNPRTVQDRQQQEKSSFATLGGPCRNPSTM
jgi:hypothetical protein